MEGPQGTFVFRLALRLNSLIFLFLSRLTFQYFFKGYMPMAKVIGQRGSECLFGGDKAQGPRDAENWGEGKKTARHRRTSTADGRAPRGRGTHGGPWGAPQAAGAGGLCEGPGGVFACRSLSPSCRQDRRRRRRQIPGPRCFLSRARLPSPATRGV